MDYKCLPKDIQQEIIKIAAQYPFTIEEVKDLYLIGGEHTDYLCQLKLRNAPDLFIQQENQRLWDKLKIE